MKNAILAAIATCFTVSVQAANVQVVHDYGQIVNPIGLDNACITADGKQIKSINPVSVCELELVETPAHGELDATRDWVCAGAPVAKSYAFSTTFTADVCVDYVGQANEFGQPECVHGTVEKTLPKTIKITEITTQVGGYSDFSSSKEFTFPTCK